MVSAYSGEVQGVVFSMFHMEMSIKVTFLFLGKRGFSINGIETIDSYEKKKLDPYQIPFIKINS